MTQIEIIRLAALAVLVLSISWTVYRLGFHRDEFLRNIGLGRFVKIKEPAFTLTAVEPQHLSDEAKVARAMRAKLAMDEFLAPALRAIEGEYLTALASLAASEPWETGKITKLAVAQRVIKAVEQHIIMSVLEGELAGKELERAKKIEALPEARRRWAV